MNMIVLIHLVFVIAGVAVALGALAWFSRVTGGLFDSVGGWFTLALVGTGGALILVGFGVIGFPGLAVIP
jgi:hypothetical protein